MFQPTVDELLEDHDWNFAEARATLTQDSSTPDFGPWSYQYTLPTSPAKCLKVRTLNKSDTYPAGQPFTTEGDKLLTDQTTASIVYTKQVTDTAQFTPQFRLCVEFALAMRLDMALYEGKRIEGLMSLFRLALSRAKMRDRAGGQGSKSDATRIRHQLSPSRQARFVGTDLYGS